MRGVCSADFASSYVDDVRSTGVRSRHGRVHALRFGKRAHDGRRIHGPHVQRLDSVASNNDAYGGGNVGHDV